jgi:hypothetical protein
VAWKCGRARGPARLVVVIELEDEGARQALVRQALPGVRQRLASRPAVGHLELVDHPVVTVNIGDPVDGGDDDAAVVVQVVAWGRARFQPGGSRG